MLRDRYGRQFKEGQEVIIGKSFIEDPVHATVAQVREMVVGDERNPMNGPMLTLVVTMRIPVPKENGGFVPMVTIAKEPEPRPALVEK